MTTTDTNISNLIINKLTKAQYDTITPNANELYLITDEVIASSDITDALGYTPQTQLVSGTNIKTINNTSILGSGNIDTNEIFVATYNSTSYADVKAAYDAGKTLYAKKTGELEFDVKYFSLVKWDDSVPPYKFIFSRTEGTLIENVIVTYPLASPSSTTWSTSSTTVADTTLSNVSSINSGSAVATALNGKANTALSNLSSTGQEKVDTVKNYNVNSSTRTSFWTGIQSEYDALKPLYVWVGSNDDIYTESSTPQVGDAIYTITTIGLGERSSASITGYIVAYGEEGVSYYNGALVYYTGGISSTYTYLEQLSSEISTSTIYNITDTGVIYIGNTLISNYGADTDLSNLSSTGQAVIDAKVNKSGDTMTGDLVISGSEDNGQGTAYLHPYLQLVQSDLTKGTAPSKPMYWGIEFNDHTNSSDQAETRMGLLECSAQADGSTIFNIRAYKNEANTTLSSALRLTISASGTATCTFPSTTCVDGQWVYSYQEAVGTSGYTIAKNTDHSWTFSNLPAQNCEVIFSYKSGGSVETAIYSSLINNNTLRATGVANQVAYGILPVGSNKQISIRNLNQNNSTTIYTFRIFGYRKIGTNTQ